MARITYLTPSGGETTVVAADGNLMTVAVENEVEGIDGDCGGVCACGTCHVRVAPEWIDRVGRATDVELGMLDLEDNATEYSRLSCQIEVTAELDGLVVKVAER